eukprot:scaffold314937_cov51-Attheya_sp.AAC.1
MQNEEREREDPRDTHTLRNAAESRERRRKNGCTRMKDASLFTPDGITITLTEQTGDRSTPTKSKTRCCVVGRSHYSRLAYKVRACGSHEYGSRNPNETKCPTTVQL